MIKDMLIDGQLKKSFKDLIINEKYNNNMWGRRYEKISKSISLIDEYYRILENFKNMNVLDIGCSSGFFSFLISDIANCVGIDVSEASIQFANKLKNNLQTSNVNFIHKGIGKFVEDDDHSSLNIDAIFAHKSLGQIIKTDKEIKSLISIINSMKIIISSGNYLGNYLNSNYFDILKIGNKIYIYLKNNK